MLGLPSDRKPCAQSSQLLVWVVSTKCRVLVTPSAAVDSWYRLMVTCGMSGSQLSCRSNCGSSKGRVEAYTTWPWIPPVSPGTYGVLPNSMNWFWPEKPCQPSRCTHGGSMRPVDSPVSGPLEPPVIGPLLIPFAMGQSAFVQ